MGQSNPAIINFPATFKTPQFSESQLATEIANYWVLPADRQEHLKVYRLVYWSANYLRKQIKLSINKPLIIVGADSTRFNVNIVKGDFYDILQAPVTAQYMCSFRAAKSIAIPAYVLIKPAYNQMSQHHE